MICSLDLKFYQANLQEQLVYHLIVLLNTYLCGYVEYRQTQVNRRIQLDNTLG